LLEVETHEVGGDWVQSLYRHTFPSETEAPNSNDNHNDNDTI